MKKIHRIVAAIALVAAAVAPAHAGEMFKFGVKAGVNVNKMSMSTKAFSSDNRVGFTGGVTAQFTVPIINVGADLSVMYVRRSSEVLSPSTQEGVTDPITTTLHSNYLDIPLHVRYNLSLPAISQIIVPYVFTGPDFAFNFNKKMFESYKRRDFDCIWDFGIGVRLIRHLEIGASYGLGMTKALKYVPGADLELNGTNGKGSTGRSNCWTVTAAWLF
ncbi:MAG: PorT family protein [Muribaculaceae bacterium]|nr:PorT family protein [Muribaculaceae bacterium]